MNLSLIDFDKLEKGSKLPPALLARVIGVDRETEYRDYLLGCLQIRAVIAAHFLTEHNLIVTIVSEKDALRILDDAPAADSNRRAGKRALKMYRSAHRRNVAVDASKLSQDEREQHTRTLEVQSKYLQAMERVKREVRLEAYKRKEPGLV